MNNQNNLMRWILFGVFITFYVLITTFTIFALFFDLGNLSSEFKKPLFTTFIIETGIGIVTLFYSLFGLRRSANSSSLPKIESEIVNNVNVVNDTPIGADIYLNNDIDLLNSYNKSIKSRLTSEGFSTHFEPSMFVFASPDSDYKDFRPTIVIQIEKNQLNQLNMTLSDFMDSGYALTQEMNSIVGKRHVRIGNTTALQWFRCNLNKVMGLNLDSDVEFTQYQKIVISDDLMGIITISYGDETKPEDMKILQDLLQDYGVKE
ncbi:MAG: hypothetical protein M0P66_13005 [Salinivirgaceae bacterium]|nr:hypothetical protein [Salinivirgaceae bacterium]